MTEQTISPQTDSEDNYTQEEAAVRPEELFRAEALEVEEQSDSESFVELQSAVDSGSISGSPALDRQLVRNVRIPHPISSTPLVERVSRQENQSPNHFDELLSTSISIIENISNSFTIWFEQMFSKK